MQPEGIVDEYSLPHLSKTISHCFKFSGFSAFMCTCMSMCVAMEYPVFPPPLCQMIDEFTDVNKGEKELMKMWNLFAMEQGYI